MVQVLQDVSPAAMIEAIEGNTAEFLVELGLAGGGEERKDPELHWIIGGSPIDYHNSVVRAALTPETADQAIAASVGRMRARGVPGTWHVVPSMQPHDLGQRLERHGFTFGGDEVGMALDLRSLPQRPSVPDALSIERIHDLEGLNAWTNTLAKGFGAGPHEAIWVGEMYAQLGFEDEGAWHHYLARLDGEPIATTSMRFGAGVAGIYVVFTLPEGRRQGIGGAITWTALRDAREMGFRVGVLGASAMRESVYRGLGFEEYCRIAIYERPFP